MRRLPRATSARDPGSAPSRLAGWLIAASGAAIAFLTLRPTSDSLENLDTFCIVCGELGTADIFANILLFVPLGIGLGLRATAFFPALLAGGLASGLVELFQLFIPGRDANPVDLAANALGTLSGVAMVEWAARRVWYRAGLGRFLFASCAAFAMLIFTAFLFKPSLTRTDYFGQWTPMLSHLEWYRGRVLSADLAGSFIPTHQIDPALDAATRLEAGDGLTVTAILGPETHHLSSLFSIADLKHEEILLVGPDRRDLIIRYRTRARDWKLHNPGYRLAGFFSARTAGDTVTLSVSRAQHGFTVTSGGQAWRLAHTIGAGWRLIHNPRHVPNSVLSILGGLWLAALFLPAAFWAPGRGARVGLSTAAVSVMIVVPAWSFFGWTPPLEWAGLATALLGGAAGRRMADHRTSRPG